MASNLSEYVNLASIRLELEATTKETALSELVELIGQGGALVNAEQFAAAVQAREALSSTGLGDGIAIPHGKSDGIGRPAVAFARSTEGIAWGSHDGSPAHLLFLIGVPEADAGTEHLVILSRLARALVRDDFRQELLKAKSPEDVLTTLKQIAF